MEPITINVTWNHLIVGYGVLHILYGVVTHYHSVFQVNKWNRLRGNDKIRPVKMFLVFLLRLAVGLPWFGITRIVFPGGNKWHMTPDELSSTLN